jgi:hypothetical protein
MLPAERPTRTRVPIGCSRSNRRPTEGELSPVVAAVFPLHRLAEAQEMFERHQHVGRIVIDVQGQQPSEKGASDRAGARAAEV